MYRYVLFCSNVCRVGSTYEGHSAGTMFCLIFSIILLLDTKISKSSRVLEVGEGSYILFRGTKICLYL